jgi:hypothetical protein
VCALRSKTRQVVSSPSCTPEPTRNSLDFGEKIAKFGDGILPNPSKRQNAVHTPAKASKASSELFLLDLTHTCSPRKRNRLRWKTPLPAAWQSISRRKNLLITYHEVCTNPSTVQISLSSCAMFPQLRGARKSKRKMVVAHPC